MIQMPMYLIFGPLQLAQTVQATVRLSARSCLCEMAASMEKGDFKTQFESAS